MGDFRIGTKAVFTQSGSDEPVLASTVTGVSLYSSIAVICEQQTADTQGGTFTSGAWRTRTLNHEITDADSIVTLSSNQFTLINGTYTIEWLAPALRCGRHVSKLVETQTPTDAGIAQAMMVNVNDSNSSSPSHGFAVVTVSSGSNNVFEIQHQCSDTRNTYGLGHYSGYAVERYTQVKILKHRN